ncbi:MAG: hypothetical protein PHX78_01870 [bacterium]|nr:hypothetical protein [bacterium]
MKCPVCKKTIICTEGKKLKLRSRIVIFDNGKATAKCISCKSDVEIPIRFNRSYELANNSFLSR